MTIVCGTDFSACADAAAGAAAALARRLELPLILVHVTAQRASDPGYEEVSARLRAETEALQARFDLEIEAVLEPGVAHERLAALAVGRNARMIVVASLGEQKPRRWLLGSVAERVAQSSPVPTLVVRDGAILEAWARGERSLRVMVGVQLSPTARAALEWANGLREVGACELHVVQIAWPAVEHRRAGGTAPMPLDRLRPELEQVLQRELEQWVGEHPGIGPTSCLVKPGFGRVDSHLILLARELGMDLLVVGTNQRAGISRLWQGSVSRGVLQAATMNVACVP
ncbi:MAG TPA: universal stress protein [Kofleriaceae bacterium]|nr:universal stress protein [Kofleriaceae bacterium]